MTNSQRLAEVRERLRDWLAMQPGEPQSETGTAEIVGESVLIVDGFYRGRRFDAGPSYAIWFMEEDELKIHSAGGELLCVFAGGEISHFNHSAAPTNEEALEQPDSGGESAPDVISLADFDRDAPEDDIRRAA